MFNLGSNCSVKDSTYDITQFSQNDKFFRSYVIEEQFNALPRITFAEVSDPQSYANYVRNLAPTMFIDLGDIHHYIALNKIHGLDTTDIEILAQIVCDYFNEQGSLHEMIWESFSENISEVLSAKLGLDEATILLTDTFNICIENIYQISSILHCYLINANTPIVETNCIYQFDRYKNGLIGLRLRTFDELKEIYSDQ